MALNTQVARRTGLVWEQCPPIGTVWLMTPDASESSVRPLGVSNREWMALSFFYSTEKNLFHLGVFLVFRNFPGESGPGMYRLERLGMTLFAYQIAIFAQHMAKPGGMVPVAFEAFSLGNRLMTVLARKGLFIMALETKPRDVTYQEILISGPVRIMATVTHSDLEGSMFTLPLHLFVLMALETQIRRELFLQVSGI
jgi:hypothetical protein